MSSIEILLIIGFCLANFLIIAAFILGKKLPIRRIKQPSCRSCGYPVTGLESFTCPECGKDLRQVGIITTKATARYKPISLLFIWFIWTIFLLAPSSLINSYLKNQFSNSQRNVDQSIMLTQPQSGVYDHISVTVKAHTFQWPWQQLKSIGFVRDNLQWSSPPNEYGDIGSTNIRIYTRDNGPPSSVVNYDPESGTAVVHSSKGTHSIHPPGKVLKHAITLAFQQSGMDTNQNAVDADIKFTLKNTGRLLGTYTIMVNQPTRRSTPIAIITTLSSVNSYRPPAWLGAMLWIIVSSLWLLGMIHYWNQYHTKSSLKPSEAK